MAMPRKHDGNSKLVVQGKPRGLRHSKQNQGSPSPTNRKREAFSKLSPVPSSPVLISSAPRTPPTTPPLSPGLLNMHYAACKFAEPPKPSSLPLPPQHWTQTNRSVIMPFCAAAKPLFERNHDITHQLKLLLKVHG